MFLVDICYNKITKYNNDNDNNINLIINDDKNNNISDFEFEFDFNTFLNIGKELYLQDCEKNLSNQNLNKNINVNLNQNLNQNLNKNIITYKMYKKKNMYLVIPMVVLLFTSILYNITVKLHKKVEVINNLDYNIIHKKMRVSNDF